MQGILTMSQKEIDRIGILKQVEEQKLTVVEASVILGLSERQTYRIIKRLRAEGTKGIIHKLRGRKSNRGYPEELKRKILTLYSQGYSDYGPTLFSDKLLEHHKISKNHETIRKCLRLNAITTVLRRKRPHRRKRERRSSYGELVQIDGSYHDWFEGRGAKCCLLDFVDDATGKVYLKFAITENTQDLLLGMWDYVIANGIPGSIYADRASVYYTGINLTDFGRALKELEVEIIYAKSPQAKGRVERFNRTLQDRLIKGLREKGISNIAQANEYLQKEFIGQFNNRFSVNPESADVHRSAEGYELKNIFCYKTSRQVRNDYTINLAGGYVQLETGNSPLPRPKQQVTVSKWLNGQLHISYNGQELNYTELKSKPKKKGSNRIKPQKDHPFRMMNNKLMGNKRRNFWNAILG